jgi:dienelactone hydrolase
MLWAAGRVDPSDAESWIGAWRQLGARLEQLARDEEAAGHLVTARRAYLRAATYYRVAERALVPPDPRAEETYAALRRCFRAAAAMFDPPIEIVELPFEGGALTGYFAKPAGTAGPLPTLIQIGGGETVAEELYFCGAKGGVERGFAVCFIDLPGQGGTLRLHGQKFRADAETPVGVIVDYLQSRDDVNPDHIAIHGFSGGGYHAPRAAAYEKRIAACITNMPWCETGQLASSGERPRGNAISVEVGKRMALASPGQADMRFDPKDLACPSLFLVSTGEQVASIEHANWFYEQTPEPKQMIVFGPDSGADTHVQANNSTMRDAAVFDWLWDIWDLGSSAS